MTAKTKNPTAMKSVPSGQFDILNNLLVELKDETKCYLILTEKELNRIICSMRYCDWSANHELIDGLTQLGQAAFGKRLGNFSDLPREHCSSVFGDNVIIEVCERLADHWIANGKTIPRYHACIANEKGAWGFGRSVEEALLDLMRSHKEMFPHGRDNLEIRYIGKALR